MVLDPTPYINGESDPRPFSEQHPHAYRVTFATGPDRLIPSLVPGVGTANVFSLVERRGHEPAHPSHHRPLFVFHT
jgi:hypothetical protein